MRKIRVGSRESALAVAQSGIILEKLRCAHPEYAFELVTMKTTGDILLDRPLDSFGGKGLFIKELDQAMLDGRIDFAVHSLKDMPHTLCKGISLAAYSRRENAYDALVLPQGVHELDVSLPIGCSSARRRLQLAALYPQTRVEPVRGNVLTRLNKLDSGQFGALVLAYAGLVRLGLEHRASRVFGVDEMIPAAGQGILAVTAREGDPLVALLSCVDDFDSRCAALAERAYVRALGVGCGAPAAAFAQVRDGQLTLQALAFDESSGRYTTGSITGSVDNTEMLGKQLAERLGGV